MKQKKALRMFAALMIGMSMLSFPVTTFAKAQSTESAVSKNGGWKRSQTLQSLSR